MLFITLKSGFLDFSGQDFRTGIEKEIHNLLDVRVTPFHNIGHASCTHHSQPYNRGFNHFIRKNKQPGTETWHTKSTFVLCLTMLAFLCFDNGANKWFRLLKADAEAFAEHLLQKTIPFYGITSLFKIFLLIVFFSPTIYIGMFERPFHLSHSMNSLSHETWTLIPIVTF